MAIQRHPFGQTRDGTEVHRFTFSNDTGFGFDVITFGGIIAAIRVPDRSGGVADVALGFDTLDGYLGEHPYFGATVGRYANRIAGAQFVIDGTTYRLAANDGENSLHGGNRGFDKVVWEVKETADERLALHHTSPDGTEGYPGTLEVSLTYALLGNSVVIDFEAVTDRPTPVNLTNHTYFNLAGHDAGTVLDHIATIPADRYTPVNEQLIPTGELAPVAGTSLDFRSPTAIGARIGDLPGGYDHNFVLGEYTTDPRLAAQVTDPDSGRCLRVLTTEPGVQFYTGNFLDGSLLGKGGTAYMKHAGFCLEPQTYPDSPNQPSFPDCIVRPGQPYRHRIVFAF